MTWFPYGPNFVIAPRDVNFERLSRRNEVGRQSLVSSITVDPTDPDTIYIVVRPSSGGVCSFRSRDGGESWTPITDALQRSDLQVDPSAFAVHPTQPNVVYMGTGGKQAVYVSPDYGDTWGPARTVGGFVRKLIVDPRTAANPSTTVLLAATDSGVYRSADGGATWARVLAGDAWSLVCNLPSTGGDDYFAGLTRQGIFHATTANGAWTNLNTQGIGLPAYTSTPPAENFTGILLGLCPRSPARVYALTVGVDGNGSVVTTGLFTTSSATTAWNSVAMTSPPEPAYGYYDLAFAVAPNSPGDGSHDVLFFGSLGISRSIDGGQHWTGDAVGFHADVHSFEFFPSSQSSVWTSGAAGTTTPVTYMGCDGGIAVSDQIAAPSVDSATAPLDWDQGLNYTDTWAWQNYNHGMGGVACYQFASDPGISALGYLACQDTGLAAGTGSAVWRSLSDADHNSIAAVRGSDAMHVWTNNGWWNLWSLFDIIAFKDNGDYGPSAWPFATLGAGGSTMQANSPFTVGTDAKCLSGVTVRDSDRASNTAVTMAGTVTITPASMAGIVAGTAIDVGPGTANEEMVTVTGITATTFTAAFAKTHPAGTTLRLQRSVVARIDGDGLGTQISQDFGQNGRIVNLVAAVPSDPNTLYCATSDGQLWTTSSATTASGSTVWTQVTGGNPPGVGMSSMAVDAPGQLYVLLPWVATVAGVTTPLFRVIAGAWSPLACVNLPSGPFGKLVADPVSGAILYASAGANVYQVIPTEVGWDWVDLSENLPGGPIYDLWCGNIGTSANPTVLLRAAIPTRGVFERNVTSGAAAPIGLYVRDNFADQGWLNPSPDGVTNPFAPSNPGAVLYHYMCADVRIDARQPGTASVAPFFQTDPEASTPPITPVRMETLKDNSENLPQADSAMVHVQVHNRGLTSANNVHVWAIYASAAAGVPALSASASQGNAFPFWSQFTVGGQIIPNLPADSPWKSVGPPQVLSQVDAAHPRVASWLWTVPTLPSGDPGHYCMAVFVHSALSPITETRMNVDVITPVNPQIGQKNLHIGAPLPPTPAPGGGPGGGGAPGDPGGRRPPYVLEEYLEFHNPTAQRSETDLLIEMRGLPPQLRTSFRISRVETATPLAQAISGVSSTHEFKPGAPPAGCLVGPLLLFLCRLYNAIRALFGRPPRPCRGPSDSYPALGTTVYEAKPASAARISGVQLPPFGSGSLVLRMHNAGNLPPGGEYVFHVQQLGDGEVLGGSQYAVRIAGERKQPEAPEGEDLAELTPDELKRRLDRERHLPGWIKENVELREKEQGKFA